MLSSFERGTISLIKSALSNTCAKIPEDYDFNKAYELSVAQQIVPIIYYGALGVEGFDKLEISKKFLLATAKLTTYSANQLDLIEEVFKSFNQNGIGGIVNASRSLMCAYKSDKWKEKFTKLQSVAVK